MNVEENKFISIGGGCFSNILLTRLDKLCSSNVRVAGPIDNLRSIHGITGSLKLFDNSLEEQLLGTNTKYSVSIKKDGKKPFDECDKEFTFQDFVIVHNDYETEKCKCELKKRFNNFNKFFLDSKTCNNHWFLYTLCAYDNLSLQELLSIKIKLENLGILNNCIFIGSNISKTNLDSYIKSNQVDWPNYNFPNWKSVFGKQYTVITESNYYDLASENFYKFLLNY